MDELSIKRAIETRVNAAKEKSYSIWTIGITDDVERRKGEHESDGENTKYWQHWKADSETIARNVEAYFLEKGMKGGTGGGDHPTFVYIF